MPLILFMRFLFSLLSLVLLAATAYLLWTWYQGDSFIDVYHVRHLVRHDWRLWTGIAGLVWSFGGGGLLIKPFLAKPDKAPSRSAHPAGEIIPGANGAMLYVEQEGAPDEPVIILTHGWGLDSTIWSVAKRDLAKTFRVVSWDLPGMGKSKAPNAAVSLSSFAENLALVIRHTGAERVVLVGHSIGGMSVQTLARDNSGLFNDRVAGVVLVNTSYHNPLKTMAFRGLAQALRFPILEPQLFITMLLWPIAWLSAWKSYLDGSAHVANRFGFGAYVTRSQLEQTTLLTIRNSQRAQAKGNLAMFRWDADRALADKNTPVLVIAGSWDIVTKPSASIHIAGTIPGAELMIVNKVNHMGFLERADLYNPAIARFASDAFQKCHTLRGPTAGAA